MVEAETVMAPVHPGEILLEKFLEPLGVSQYQLAMAVDVPARRINEIVHGKRRISADTALRLARNFGTSERFWINLQARYDLEVEKDRLGAALDDIRPRAPRADGQADYQPERQTSRHRDSRDVNGPAGQSLGTRKITNEPGRTRLTCVFSVERVTGIEPALSAWEASSELGSPAPSATVTRRKSSSTPPRCLFG
jgi:addiction module HigA family antidote